MDAAQLLEPLDQLLQLFLVMDIDLNIAFEQSFLRLDGHGADVDPQFPGDEVGDLIDDAYIVHAYDADTREKGYLFIFSPFGLYDPVSIAGHQSGCIGTIGAMNGKSFAHGYKPEYIISRNGLTAVGKGVHNAVAAFPKDDQLGVLP